MAVLITKTWESRKRIGIMLIVPLVVGLAAIGIAPQGHSNPGILRVPQSYPTIQAAIIAANPGDTVLVTSGTYNDPLTISKSLNLTGLARDTTIIDPQENGPGINITRTSAVFVSGFTIRGTGFFYDGIDIFSSTGVTISGNRISASNQSLGLFILNSSSVTVRNNIISGNDAGVNLQNGFGNILQGNNVTLNNIAIGIVNSKGNQVKDNWLGLGPSGLQLLQSQGNVVSRNRIFNNTGNAVFLWNSTANRFLENDIAFTMGQSSSIGIRFQNSTGNQLYYNNMRNNTIHVFGVFTGDISQNNWNDGGSNRRGNYWSDYTGLDDGSNGRIAGDGVGDTAIPHPCPFGGRPCSSSASGPAGVDNYPLISPWTPPTLSVTASATRTSGYVPLNVSFTGTVSGGAAPYVFKWEFGTGVTSNLQNVTYTYQAIGSYVAVLIVTDDTMASRSDLVPITVLSIPPPPKGPDLTPLVLITVGVLVATAVSLVVFVRRRKASSSIPTASKVKE